ncbi:MAG: hypothetical protein KGO92_13085 [Bacteroidota bacterium]|nr:hypothetical protein [Bacteroidota bacterium]
MRNSALLMLIFFASCRFNQAEVPPVYDKYVFDSATIAALPSYDSLVSAILKNSSYFLQNIDKRSAYQSYKFRPGSDAGDTFRKIPDELAPLVNYYYNQIPKDFIYGFDFFTDSTVKIYIRHIQPDSSRVDIFEHLSYFPNGNIRRRSLPEKDSVLSKHWLYWVQFYRSRLF